MAGCTIICRDIMVLACTPPIVLCRPSWCSRAVSRGENEFRVRIGRTRATKAPKPKSFVAQVLKAVRKAGPAIQRSANAGRAHMPGRSNFGRGKTAFSRDRLFSPARRVVLKARVVRHQGRRFSSAPISAHLSYLKREGVSRDGERGVMFNAEADRVDDRAFAERCANDRHHFRFIVSPEDAAEMTDLKAFARDLAQQMEADLGTRLDWVAVDHWNTDNPHLHLLVRGIDDAGSDLVISRDYISRGLRARAEGLVSIELGPKLEHAIRSAIEQEVGADRWTRLDVEIQVAADESGLIDLRPAQPGPDDPELRRLMVDRLQKLERMGLAASAGPGQWLVDHQTEQTLRDLGARGDIIKAMHRAFAGRAEDRGIGNYVINTVPPESPITGRLVDKGLHDELTGEAYAVIDGTDGHAHHVRFRGIEAFEHAPPIGGIVEVRRFGGPDDPRPTLILATRSDFDLDRQINARGATWLDHRLIGRQTIVLAMDGFGGEVRAAMKKRADHLVQNGLARQLGDHITFERNLLAALRRRELDTVTARLSAETGLPRLQSEAGDYVTGIYRQRLSLSSGRFAMIDASRGFQLVPWSPTLEKKLGKSVSGTIDDKGGIDWSVDRKRNLGI